MTMYGTRICDDSELRRQLANERYERERAEDNLRQIREQQDREREERRRERIAASRQWLRTASNWPDALSKQSSLFIAESGLVDDEDGSDYFADGAAACNRALVLWQEEQARTQPLIDALQEQIDDLRASIRTGVAQKLRAESNAGGWCGVANALQEYDDDSCGAWLDW